MPTKDGDTMSDKRSRPFDFLAVEDFSSGEFTAWVRGLPPDDRAAAAAFAIGWARTEGRKILEELAAERPTYRFCRTCREREGDCHCSFLGKAPDWEARDKETHLPAGEPAGDPAVEFVLRGPGPGVVPLDATFDSSMSDLDRMLEPGPDLVEEWGLGSEIAELRRSLQPSASSLQMEPCGHDPLDGEGCG